MASVERYGKQPSRGRGCPALQPKASEFLAHPRDYDMVCRQCPQQVLKDGPIGPRLGKLAASCL